MDLKSLLGSKAIVLVVAIVGVIAMNVSGRVEGARALDFIQWIITAWFAAEAASQAASSFAAAKVGAAEKTAAGLLIADPKVTDNATALAELKGSGKADP